MSSQDIQLPLNSHWLDSVGWRTVGHCSTQSDKRVVRKSRQVYRTIVQSETRPNGGETKTANNCAPVNEGSPQAEIPGKIREKFRVRKLTIDNIVKGQQRQPELPKSWSSHSAEASNSTQNDGTMSRHAANSDLIETKSKPSLLDNDKQPSPAPRDYSHRSSSAGRKADYIVGLRGESPPTNRTKRSQKREEISTADFEPIEDDFNSSPSSGVKSEVKSEWYKQMFKSMNPDSVRTSEKDFVSIEEDDLPAYKDRSSRRPLNFSHEQTRSKSNPYQDSNHNPTHMNSRNSSGRPKADHFREFLDFDDSPQTDSRDRRAPNNHIETDLNNDDLLNGFGEVKRRPDYSDSKSAPRFSPNDSAPQGGYHRSRSSLDQKTLLKLAASVNDMKDPEEKGKPTDSVASGNRGRKERPKRIDEFHQIKNYFDTLSKNAEEESNLRRNSRRTQSLDRAKVSNRSQALGNKNFENIQRKFNSPNPGPGNISERRNEDQADGKKVSKWKLSSVDEYYLTQRQYRYTVREPKASFKPPRPQLPPSSAIDTDFITQNISLDRSNGDIDSGYARSSSPRDIHENGTTDERHDQNPLDHPNNGKSTYALSLHPSRNNPQQFGGHSEMRQSPNSNTGYLEKTENVEDVAESDSDDTASLPSQVENYHRPGSSQNVVRDPVVRANLEEKIQKCKGKINGNHDIYGSRNSLKQQTEVTDQIDIGWNQPLAKKAVPLGAPVSRTNSGRKPLVQSGIDIWQNRIEAVETAKNRSLYDPELPLDDSFNQQNSPGQNGPERFAPDEMIANFDDPHIDTKDEFTADSKDGLVVTPTDSNKSSMKESEAEAPEYNFYLSNRSFLNSIPQPYNKLKVGAPYESSEKFRKRPGNIREQENRNVPKATSIGPDSVVDNLNDVTKNVERMFDAPTKVNDEFSEQGEKTFQREFVEQLVYFPKSKEFFTIDSDRDRQQVRFKSDPHYFITVTRKQTEEVVTKIDSGTDNNCPKIPINEDVRSFAREITNRRTGSAERSPNAPNFDSFDPRPAQHPLDRFADTGSSRTNLNAQNHLKETVLNSPTKKQDYSGLHGSRKDPALSEGFNSSSNLRGPDPRDSLLSPIQSEFRPVRDEFSPPHHSTTNRSNTEPRDGFQSSNRDLSRVDSSNRYRKNNTGNSNARVALSSRGPTGNRSASVDALNVVSSDGRDTNSLSDFKITREIGTRMPLSQHRSQNLGSYSYINGTNNDEIVPLTQKDNTQKVFKDDSPDEYGIHSRRDPVNGASSNMSMSASALNEFNSKEADSGVELDYNPGPNSDDLRMFQSESNLYDDKRLAPASDRNDESPIAVFGNADQPKNDNVPAKESSSRPIKKKIFKKKPKNRDDLNGGASSAQSGTTEDGGISPTSPPVVFPTVTSGIPASKTTNKPSATVLFTFRPEFQGEIAVQKGDVVSVIRNIDENWVEIEAPNGVGIVPKDYIKHNKSSESAAPKASPNPKEKQNDKKGGQPNIIKNQSQKPNDQYRNMEKPRGTGFSASEKHADPPKNTDKAGSMKNLNGSSMKPLTIQVNNYNNDKQQNHQRAFDVSTAKDRNAKSSKPANSHEVKRVRVKHNFRAENDDDLALKVNEIVNVTKRVDENWYEGTIGKRRGIFPVNCVEVIETHENLEPSPGAYSPQPGVETSFNSTSPNKGVSVTSHQSDKLPQWQSNNSLNSLGRMKAADQESLQDLPPGEPFKVIFRYQHQKPDELDLEEGDILYAIEKCDDGWFIGTSERTGKYGTFPGNYVTKINL